MVSPFSIGSATNAKITLNHLIGTQGAQQVVAGGGDQGAQLKSSNLTMQGMGDDASGQWIKTTGKFIGEHNGRPIGVARIHQGDGQFQSPSLSLAEPMRGQKPRVRLGQTDAGQKMQCHFQLQTCEAFDGGASREFHRIQIEKAKVAAPAVAQPAYQAGFPRSGRPVDQMEPAGLGWRQRIGRVLNRPVLSNAKPLPDALRVVDCGDWL
jgi:hypothetical protein